jgi:hypothetical protein
MIVSMLGNTMWVLFNPATVLPNAWGNSLNASAYTWHVDIFGKTPFPFNHISVVRPQIYNNNNTDDNKSNNKKQTIYSFQAMY